MKNPIQLLILFIIISNITFAQQNANNSKKKSKNQAQYYYEKSLDFPNNELDSTIYYSQLGYQLAKDSKNDSLVLKIVNILGFNYRLKEDYKQAFYFDSIAYSLSIKLKDSVEMFLAITELAGVEEQNENYTKAINYYKKGLHVAKKMNDSVGIVASYNYMGLVYLNLNQLPLSESYFLKSLNYVKKEQSIKGSLGDYIDDTIVLYTSFVILYSELSKKEKAYFYLDKLKELMKKENTSADTFSIYELEGITFLEFEEYDKALQSFEKQLKISSIGKDTVLIKRITRSVVNTSLELKDFTKAAFHFKNLVLLENTSKEIYLNDGSTLNDYHEYYYFGIEVYKNTGNYKKALTFSESLTQILDSINNKEIDDTFAEYGKKFESEQKDKEIALQQLELSEEKTKRNSYIFGSVLVLLVLTILYLIIYFKQEKKKNTIKLALNNEKDFRKLRSHFLENISHEIRTPITLVQGYINLIKKHKNSPKEIENYANKALQQSSKAIDDANDVLQLLKVEKAMLTLKSSKRPLNVFINDTFFAFKHKAQQEYQSLRYFTNINNDLEVELDYEKLEKILTNLISNALKYSPQYTEITVQCIVTTRNLSIIVKDEGIGIAIDEQGKIFSKFYQTINNKTTGGLGIGLSLVKELTQFLNGTITVDSELGKGSCFTVKIPIKISDKLSLYLEKNETHFTPIKEELTTLKQEIVGNRQLLIVDDNKELVNYLCEILTPLFNCDCSYNGIEALSKVKEKPYDLILSDLMMPEMDGFKFKKELNKIQGYEKIPFLMLTANALIETKIEGFTIGINDYITKPFNERELIARIKNLLKNKQLQNKTIRLFDESDILIDDSKSFDKQFLNNITLIVQDNLDNETFKVSDLAFECSYSKRQLTRIMRKNTGLSPAKFILELRLLKAYELIINKTYPNLNEVMYLVGISTYHSFNTTFYNRFGIKPNELLKMKKSTG